MANTECIINEQMDPFVSQSQGPAVFHLPSAVTWAFPPMVSFALHRTVLGMGQYSYLHFTGGETEALGTQAPGGLTCWTSLVSEGQLQNESSELQAKAPANSPSPV